MSDNLKVAKECGATVLEDGCIIFHHSTQLDKHTSRILASQQAAHEAEIAKLKEEMVECEQLGAVKAHQEYTVIGALHNYAFYPYPPFPEGSKLLYDRATSKKAG